MDKVQLSQAVGEVIVSNWQWFVGSFFGFVVGCVSLCWFISSTIHRREIDLLKSQISFGDQKLNQLEKIMGQRINAAEKEAEKLQGKLVTMGKLKPDKGDEPVVFYQKSVEDTPTDKDEDVYFSKTISESDRETEQSERISTLIASISTVVEKLVKFNTIT